jgi:hypothetical protein
MSLRTHGEMLYNACLSRVYRFFGATETEYKNIAVIFAFLLTGVKCSYIVLSSLRGEVAEWLMAADCKSALLRVRWFESSPLHHFGISQ